MEEEVKVGDRVRVIRIAYQHHDHEKIIGATGTIMEVVEPTEDDPQQRLRFAVKFTQSVGPSGIIARFPFYRDELTLIRTP